jgi:4-amino-4-deoxy-L-arabinose transferase-like glycosyltransferase
LALGRGYVDDAGHPLSFRPPTYPLFLAGVFRVAGVSIGAVEVVQSLLAAAGAAALALWVGRRWGRAAGMTTGILVALDPILVPVPAFILTEALGTVLVVAIVICLERGLATRRSGLLLLAGLLGGAAALNTPITLLLVPWLLLTAWVLGSPARPGWRAGALALGLLAVCLGAWSARNYMVRGEVVVVREGGFGVLVWGTTVYDFNWIPSPLDPGWPELDRKFQALTAGRTGTEGHSLFLQEAWRNVREHPFLVLKRVLKANFWFWVEAPGSHISGELRPVRWVTLGFHLIQLLGFAAAVWALGRAGLTRAWALWLSTILYFALFLSLMFPIPRYYVPVLPVMDTLIAVGLTRLAGCGGVPRSPGADASPGPGAA